MAAGKAFAGINTTEPGGGSDLGAIKTIAPWNEEKQAYVMNGEKAYVSGPKECEKWGAPSGHCTLVKTDPAQGHKGMTFIWVPAHLDGITYTTYKDMGRMGLSTGGWIYKDVELPKKYVLGEEGKGFYVNMDGFNAARVLVAAACLGGSGEGARDQRRVHRAAHHVRQAARQERGHLASRWPTTGCSSTCSS